MLTLNKTTLRKVIPISFNDQIYFNGKIVFYDGAHEKDFLNKNIVEMN